jgi:hypothetical protein
MIYKIVFSIVGLKALILLIIVICDKLQKLRNK